MGNFAKDPSGAAGWTRTSRGGTGRWILFWDGVKRTRACRSYGTIRRGVRGFDGS